MLEFQNIKIFIAKGYTSSWSEEVFVVSKITNTVLWTYVVNDLLLMKLLDVFMKKNCKKLVNKKLE